MKFGYFVLLYSAVVVIAAGIGLGAISRNNRKDSDLVAVNGSHQQLLRELDAGFTPSEVEHLEQKYQCQILLTAEADYESELVDAINRSELIFDYTREGFLLGKIIFAGEGSGYAGLRRVLAVNITVMAGVLLIGGYGSFLLLYFRILRPFYRLKNFAREVAKGNLELPLHQTRGNFFGAFTESFDLMREELKRARENEYRANISKKELVAGLSHDIKTPVATIKAACELLQARETSPDTLNKVGVIAGKAEIIQHLIENMFHATLEELEVLAVQPAEISSQSVAGMLTEWVGFGRLRLQNEIPPCLVWADAVRLHQIIDNIVSNSYKYAGTEIRVSFSQRGNGICLQIRDSGAGVPPEELPLLTGKFYRGSNAAGKDGSGLGLYLANHFISRMGGEMLCYCDDGFVVELFLLKV